MEIINLHKKCNKTKTVVKTAPKAPKSGHHLFLRKQLDEMTNYRSIVSRGWKEIKKDPARLTEYHDRARQMQNEAEELGDDSQNKKTVADRPKAKHLEKVPKTPEFVDTDSDDMDDKQGPASKQLKKRSKTPEFVDTGPDDSDDEQERQPKKASKTSEYLDDEQGPAVKCIVMYSTEDEQGPTVKKPQKEAKTSGYSDEEQEPAAKCIVMYSNEDEQEPAVKKLQKATEIPKFVDTSPGNEDPQEASPGELTKKLPATSCTHIMTYAVRRDKQCRLKASDKRRASLETITKDKHEADQPNPF